MLYRIESLAEAKKLEGKVPRDVYEEILRQTTETVVEEGSNSRGCCFDDCSLVLETSDDLLAFREVIDYCLHPCEEARCLGKDGEWLYALYLMNNDFSIGVFMPTAIAPDELIEEMEEN